MQVGFEARVEDLAADMSTALGKCLLGWRYEQFRRKILKVNFVTDRIVAKID